MAPMRVAAVGCCCMLLVLAHAAHAQQETAAAPPSNAAAQAPTKTAATGAAAAAPSAACAKLPSVLNGRFDKEGCPLPAAVGATCTATCNKNKWQSYASVPAPVATCTAAGWQVANACQRVCMGAPDAALLRGVDVTAAEWPAACADTTPFKQACSVPCKSGVGSVSVVCYGKWDTRLNGKCDTPPAAGAAQPAPEEPEEPAVSQPAEPGPQGPQQQQAKPAPAVKAPQPPAPAARPRGEEEDQEQQAPLTSLAGVLVDGHLAGGSPRAQTVTEVNLFDPGRVLLRPPAFTAQPVANEVGHLDVPISEAGTEFGAFVGTRAYQVAQLADFTSEGRLNITWAHAGSPTCLEAATLQFVSRDFTRLGGPPVVSVDEFAAGAGAAGAGGGAEGGKAARGQRVRATLIFDTLSVWVPPVCLAGPESRVTALIDLLL